MSRLDADERGAPELADVASRLPPTYRLVRELARSEMSVVYLAEEPALARWVAVKVLSPEVAADAMFRARFTREVGIAAGLDHPNIIPIYAAGESNGLLYLTMRYVEGGDLGSALHADGPFGLDESVLILGQVAEALDVAHRAGLVHRDVKPGNILLDRRTNHAYLCDFGIATYVSAAGSFTRSGRFIGTIDYVAPEQIRGLPTDARTDIYALGGVTYRCLTGRSPFGSEEPAAVLWSHLNEPPPRVTEGRPDLPARLDRVLATAMAKDPAARYGSCRAFVDDLRRERPAAVSTPRRWRPWTAALLASAGALVLAGLVVGLTLLLAASRPGSAELARVPAALQGDCRQAPDDQAYPGAARTLSCRDGAGQEALVGLFDTDAPADEAYRAALGNGSGVQRSTGECAERAGAEHRYPGVGDPSGRVLCYVKDGTARLAWTDRAARIVGVAQRRDGNDLALYRSWAGWVGVPAYPAPQEQALLDILPESQCRRAPSSSLDGLPGAVVAIDCQPQGSGARTVRYHRFADLDGLRRGYQGLVAAAAVPAGPSCISEATYGSPGESNYDVRSVQFGRLLCSPAGQGESAVTWTAESVLVLGHAVGPDPVKLLNWWYDARGPRFEVALAELNKQAQPPFPTPQESALLAHIPEPSRVNCARVPPDQVKANVGDAAVVGVTCGTTRGPPIVFFYQFADAAAMNNTYGSRPAGPDCTALPANFQGEARYTRPTGATGTLSCGVNTGGRSFLEWTADGLNILVLAIGDDQAQLVSWWQQDAGPV